MDKLELMRKRFAEFTKVRDWEKFHNPKDLAMKIAIESVELMELFEWKTSEESYAIAKERRKEVESEIADVITMVIEFANITGIDLYEAFNKKMDLNEKRYPADKARGKNYKYTHYQ